MPTWINRIWQEYRAGNLTRAHRDVLLTLHTFRSTGGRCWPSHATLADRAKCCTRTVQRALQQARHLGLVDWYERHVRAAWRWLRTSNLYWFLAPDAPVQVAARPVSKAPGRGRAKLAFERGEEALAHGVVIRVAD
jgi:Helix-turn-helix domain